MPPVGFSTKSHRILLASRYHYTKIDYNMRCIDLYVYIHVCIHTCMYTPSIQLSGAMKLSAQKPQDTSPQGCNCTPTEPYLQARTHTHTRTLTSARTFAHKTVYSQPAASQTGRPTGRQAGRQRGVQTAMCIPKMLAREGVPTKTTRGALSAMQHGLKPSRTACGQQKIVNARCT